MSRLCCDRHVEVRYHVGVDWRHKMIRYEACIFPAPIRPTAALLSINNGRPDLPISNPFRRGDVVDQSTSSMGSDDWPAI